MIKLKDINFYFRFIPQTGFDFKDPNGKYYYTANAWCLADKTNECVYGERWHKVEKESKKGNYEKFLKSNDYKLLVKGFKQRALKAIREKVKEFLNKNGKRTD